MKPRAKTCISWCFNSDPCPNGNHLSFQLNGNHEFPTKPVFSVVTLNVTTHLQKQLVKSDGNRTKAASSAWEVPTPAEGQSEPSSCLGNVRAGEGGPKGEMNVSHVQNPVVNWSTQNHASRFKKAAAAICGWAFILIMAQMNVGIPFVGNHKGWLNGRKWGHSMSHSRLIAATQYG